VVLDVRSSVKRGSPSNRKDMTFLRFRGARNGGNTPLSGPPQGSSIVVRYHGTRKASKHPCQALANTIIGYATANLRCRFFRVFFGYVRLVLMGGARARTPQG